MIQGGGIHDNSRQPMCVKWTESFPKYWIQLVTRLFGEGGGGGWGLESIILKISDVTSENKLI